MCSSFSQQTIESHLSLSFCIQFFKHHVNIALQCVLASAIERKIVLMIDVWSKRPITIRSHNLHVDDIKGAVGEIASYTRGTSSLSFFFGF